ncbi:MAG TPA: S8/S53 family peptidase [Streptosporangiaceae bacterium]
MDPVFDAQYLMMKDSFNTAGHEIAVAHTRAGEVDYVYEVDVLLARRVNVPQLQDVLPRLRRDFARPRPAYGDLVLLPIGGDGHHDEDGHLTVPQALDLIENRAGREKMFSHGEPLATAAHIVHTAKLCAATEPEVPGVPAPAPYPPPAAPGAGQERIKLGISDTGLWEQPPPDLHSWLAGVAGVADLPGPTLAGGQLSIPYEGGHGTMVAGMARCTAPGAGVYVGNHFPYTGGTLEYMLASDLETLIADQSPDLINLSAGGYTHRNAPPLSFIEFRDRHRDVTLVAAAGNDSTDRKFWPAAFDWAIAVGALGADLQNLAWFSNHGDWVNVYALGEGVVNAFATGVYTYHVPPKQPAKQVFDGMARWSGTSFSAPLVAGLIVAEMARSQSSAMDAWQAVRGTAANTGGFGPVLLP